MICITTWHMAKIYVQMRQDQTNMTNNVKEKPFNKLDKGMWKVISLCAQQKDVNDKKIAGYNIWRQNLAWCEISTNKTYKWLIGNRLK